MTILKSSSGVELRKLETPDGKNFCYTVVAKGLPIQDKRFNDTEYDKALDYYEQSVISLTRRNKT